jgi:two-component system sensor kinase FixL
VKQRLFAVFGLWIPLALVAIALAGTIEYVRMRDAFERDGSTVHRILSQRVDQHDAHLTSLAAVLANSDAPSPVFQGVVEAMQRFYPRIAAVDLIGLSGSPEAIFSSGPSDLQVFSMAALAMRARDLAPGQAGTVAAQNGAPYYALVKRLPDGGAGPRALTLKIDAALLSEPEGGLPDGVALNLRDAGGTLLLRTGVPQPAGSLIPALSFEKALASRSQPLVLQLTRQPVVTELLSPLAAIGLIAATGLGVLLLFVVLRERRTTARARAAAQVHAQDARLAHAMRVNTVGEMASGIAHEITQPLTAILSQSQAGLRLARSDGGASEDLVGVLEANVRHARRAGDILDRLRAYVSKRDPVRQPTDLNLVIRNVVELIRRDLDDRMVALRLELSSAPLFASVDRVSMEQVVHNLVRNAAEALETMPAERRVITISSRLDGGEIEVAVADQGAGISGADMARLFEPFFTTKSSGMGLGLPLCERLVEAASGRIDVGNGADCGSVFAIRLPALIAAGAVAAE